MMDFLFSRRVPAGREVNALGRALARRLAEGRPVMNLAEGNPTKAGVFLPGVEVLAALSRPGCLSYDPDPRGLPSARAAVAAWYASGGVHVDPADLFLAASTSEAYGWLFKLLCDPGDAVLVPSPGYPLFDHLAGLEGVESVPYPIEYLHPQGWRLDLGAFLSVLRNRKPRAVILIHPNNPTGSYIDPSQRSLVLEACRESRTPVIADEVFLHYALDDRQEPSFAGETDTPCFVLNGISKLLGLPQMKLGWIVLAGPRAFRSEAASRLEIIADAYLPVGAPILHALPELLPMAGAFVESLRGRLAANLAALRRATEGEGSPYRVLRCSAGWTAVLEVPRVASEEELTLGLLRDEGIYLHPGYFFDFPREAYLMISLLPRAVAFLEAVGRIRAFLDYSVMNPVK